MMPHGGRLNGHPGGPPPPPPPPPALSLALKNSRLEWLVLVVYVQISLLQQPQTKAGNVNVVLVGSFLARPSHQYVVV